ncbi:22820_t:CDS:2 [Rhizophagus irregularis]|nr:22820_t:CDS:2 [Rhizophagus irregularis]
MNYGLINCKIVESCFKAGGTIIINEQVAKKVLEILDNDNLLNSQEKLEAKKDIIRGLDTYNLKENNDFKYYCNKCNLKGRTNLNCEHCVRNILIENFNKWTSGIMIITFSSETDSFLRTGPIPVILKRLPDSYMYDEKSFNELQIHIRASFWGNHAVTLYGVTRDESTNLKNLMLVLRPMVCNLWEFCSERLTWKDVYQAFWFIANGLTQLHSKGLLHQGERPRKILDIPIEYNLLMKRCWNEDPKERPNAQELLTFFTEVITNENEEKYNFLKNYIKEKEDNKYPIQVQMMFIYTDVTDVYTY